jgi:hypothetical protein
LDQIVLALEEHAVDEDPSPVYELYDSNTMGLLQKIRDIVTIEVDSFARNKPQLWRKLELEVLQQPSAYKHL